MNLETIKKTVQEITFKPLMYVLVLSAIIFNFLLSLSSSAIKITIAPDNTMAIFLILSACMAGTFLLYAVIQGPVKRAQHPSIYTSIIMFPIALLFYADSQNGLILPFSVVAGTALIFHFILFHRDSLMISATQSRRAIALISIAYFLVISLVIIHQYQSQTLFNMKDFSNYNETFRNTIHEKFFQNALYGSNVACHNTWFYLLIIPFYFIMPHPMTPMIIKTLLISLSVIPFYLNARLHVKENAVVPLTMCFLLFTIYFFKKQAFRPFVIFLFFCLTIKEHLAFIAMMFGIYAIFQKRSLRWIVVPIVAGILWAGFSFIILSYFKEVYSAHATGDWLIEDLKARFLFSGSNILSSMKSGLLSSNALNTFTMSKIAVYVLLPIGVFIPLLGSTSYLCLPEALLNLLSDRPALFSATRHYNIVMACCLLIGMIEGIRILSRSGFVKKLMMEEGAMYYLWLAFI